MAFLGRSKKVDLQCLAEELGETVTKDMKVVDLKKKILGSTEYEEEFVKELLERIVNEREEEIKRQNELESKRQENEFELEKKRQENEFVLEKVNRSVDKIPITPVCRPELPFQVVNVDLIGPVEPISSQGHKYILCLMDQHSRWPEAVPLKSLTAKNTCEALLEIFSRTGIPEVIVMDNATNFTSRLTQEFLKILGACPRFSTPYHPEGNGLIERWNQTFKNMLHHTIREEGRSWHRQIPFLLWAYREVPNATTGVPPFLLMYGREPKGPLSILKSALTGEILLPLNLKGSVENYLKELRGKLEVATRKAKLTSEVQQSKYAEYYNIRKKPREFIQGDQVLVLIPDSTNKLYARWIGPVEVVRRVKPNSYYLRMPEENLRLLHVNKMREYKARIQTVGVVYDTDEEFGEIYETPKLSIAERNDEGLERVNGEYLTEIQQKQLKDLLYRYKTLFSGRIKRAKVGEHVISFRSTDSLARASLTEVSEFLLQSSTVLKTHLTTATPRLLGIEEKENFLPISTPGSVFMSPMQTPPSMICREGYPVERTPCTQSTVQQTSTN
ncbi:unnamed protein product [Larinioides sclopetarius]|uniref:Integrase catalytic domain-containing protein n=1 Tax=Larinioides sclopetarius TaxID=280406 RepID=A0AAV2AXY8_9ARAC